jgi:benzoyl-CoA reductase/2-hydroxyglutaryl-CoA dehydratase subunit BcrC/BadD/HgdB
LKKVAELWEYQGDLEIFKLGIPHRCMHEFEVEYFTDRLKALKDRLQILTGNSISDKGINEAIAQYNTIRRLFRQISLQRRNAGVPITSQDFIKLNHLSFYTNPALTIELLEEVFRYINKLPPEKISNAPRLLITGPNVCKGDYKLLELIEEMGGNVVIEEIFEGIRDYWQDIPEGKDPFKSLAEGYLVNRIPPAFMRDTAKKRLDRILKLTSEFNVAGVVWYELMYCETYDAESFYLAQKLKEHNIPLLILESDYSKADIGQLRTRLQAFMEMLSEWRK